MRVAITANQVEALDLEPIVKTDHRYSGGRTHEAWETEALGQGRVMALVREALDDRLPEPLDDVLERERVARRARSGSR